MNDTERGIVFGNLLRLLQARVEQLKVKSPGEAEAFFLSKIDDSNPIKELLVLQAHGQDYRSIETRLQEMLQSDLEVSQE